VSESRKLRDLADALDRLEKASSLPGIGTPSQIVLAGRNGEPLSGYGDNPTLLAAIVETIRIEWDRLRDHTLDRLAANVGAARKALQPQGTADE
jgi:hypothetical protein